MGYSSFETCTHGIIVAVMIMCSSCAWHTCINDVAYNYHDSLYMSHRGNGVLHYQIHSNKVDFTFSPKCWGSNSPVMFDSSK